MSRALATHAEELLGEYKDSQRGLRDNYLYYEAEKKPQAVGLATPPQMQDFLAAIGWSRTYLDSIGDRLSLEGFRLAGESESDDRLWEWWQANRLDEKSGLGHTEALLHGRAYIVVSHPDTRDPMVDPTVPVIDVLSPLECFAQVDRRSGKVKRAIRVQRDGDDVQWVTIYLPHSTTVLERGPDGWAVLSHVPHNLGVVPVVPLLNRNRLTEIYGTSQITKELRSVSDAAARVMMNLQASAELMAVPQRVIFGVDPDKISDDPTSRAKTFQAYLARILAFDADGHATQFPAADLRNFTEVMRELTTQAASYTGLPMLYYGLSSDNPASADALRASETRLVTICERKAKMFGGAWEQAMRIALLIMDKKIPKEAFRMEAIWRNPATPTLAAIADAVVKMATAITADGRPLVPVEMARIKLGFSDGERKQMEKWDKARPAAQLERLYGPRGPQQQQDDDASRDVERAA